MDALHTLQVLLAAAAGGSAASFAAVAAERIPRGETLGGRSHCACGRTLTATENLPVVGWLRAAGRTRCCQRPIPAWYLGAELAGGGVAAASMATSGPVGTVAAVLTVAAVGLAVGQARKPW